MTAFFYMPQVYIIYSHILDKFYTGKTINLTERLIQHNTGLYANAFTAKTDDWEVFLTIDCVDNKQALAIESHIKKMKSRKYIKDLMKYPQIINRLKDMYN